MNLPLVSKQRVLSRSATSGQGATIGRVLVNVDTDQRVAPLNQRQFYVSISHTRLDAQMFTNKPEELAQAVSRAWPKSTALDAVTGATAALRLSPRQRRGTHNPMAIRREGQGEHQAGHTPPAAPVAGNEPVVGPCLEGIRCMWHRW
jgi:hypothetical protein